MTKKPPPPKLPKPKNPRLTARQKRFIELYAGNAEEAAKAAGYAPRSAAKAGNNLMRNPTVIRAIRERMDKESQASFSVLVTSRKARQEWWAKIMESDEYDIRDRLKASELLSRSQADFTDNVNLNAKLSLVDLINKSMEPEVIEASYTKEED